MFKCKPSAQALGVFYRNILCLTLGLLIGIRFTSFWYNLQYTTVTSDDLNEDEEGSFYFDKYGMLSEYLFNNTRVLCWIMTNPTNHMFKAIHIRRTWGKRCNKLLFMSTQEDKELPTVKLNVEEGRHNLWNKTKEALNYVYQNHYNDADWFLKADDDT